MQDIGARIQGEEERAARNAWAPASAAAPGEAPVSPPAMGVSKFYYSYGKKPEKRLSAV